MASYDLTIKAVDQTKSALANVQSGLANIQATTDKVNKGLDVYIKRLQSISSVGFAAFALVKAQAISYASALNDASEASNVALKSILALGQALTTNGGNSDQAAQAVIKLTNSIGDAASGSDSLRKAFERTGVTLNDLKTLSETEIFQKTILGLGNISDASVRASTATDIYGKSLKGVNIKGVADDLVRLTQEQTTNAEATAAAAQASDRVKNAFNQLQIAIIKSIEPAARFINSLDPKTISEAVAGLVKIGAAFTAIYVGSKVVGTIDGILSSISSLTKVTASATAVATTAAVAQVGYTTSLLATSTAQGATALSAAFMAGAYARVGSATTALLVAEARLVALQESGTASAIVLAKATDAVAAATARLAIANQAAVATQGQLATATTATSAAIVTSTAALTGWTAVAFRLGQVVAAAIAFIKSPITIVVAAVVGLQIALEKAFDINVIDIFANKLEQLVTNNFPSVAKAINEFGNLMGMAPSKMTENGIDAQSRRMTRATEKPEETSRIVKDISALGALKEAYRKTQEEYKQFSNAIKAGIKDQSLLAAVFDAAAAAALKLGIVLAKPAELIGREFRIAVEQASQANDVFRTQLALTELTLQKFDNEIADSSLKLVEQEARLASVNQQQMIYNNEIRQGALAITDANARLKDKYLQERLLTQQLENTRIKQTQQTVQLELLNKRYSEGTIGLRDYAEMLGQMDQRLLSIGDTVKMTIGQGQDEIDVNNTRAAALRKIATEYDTGRISITEYSLAYSKLADQYSNTPLDVVVNQANRTVSKIQELKNQARSLDTALSNNTITWKQYGEAVKTIGEEYFPNFVANTERAMTMAELLDKTLETGMKRAGDALTTNLVTAINTGKGLLSSFKGFFNTILNDIAAAIVRKQFVIPITTSLNGAMGGGGGFLSNIFGNLFGGGGAFNGVPGMDAAGNFAGVFANGGNIGSGQWGIAGEKGAEVITGPATVTPMDKLSSGSGDPIVVNLSLNAIDTRSGIEFLVQNRAVVTGIVQDAFTRRAQRGLI